MYKNISRVKRERHTQDYVWILNFTFVAWALLAALANLCKRERLLGFSRLLILSSCNKIHAILFKIPWNDRSHCKDSSRFYYQQHLI